MSQVMPSTEGSVKAGCLPRKASTMRAPNTAARTTPPRTRLPNSLLSISSRTNVMAASGVLKAAASEAAAPVAEGCLRPVLGAPMAAAILDATPAADVDRRSFASQARAAAQGQDSSNELDDDRSHLHEARGPSSTRPSARARRCLPTLGLNFCIRNPAPSGGDRDDDEAPDDEDEDRAPLQDAWMVSRKSRFVSHTKATAAPAAPAA